MKLLTKNGIDGVAAPKRRTIHLYLGLVAANILVWAWALVAFRGHASLLGTALLAYSFGLRHAVDADHIAAIDNVTRKFAIYRWSARGRVGAKA
jgi:high-affinity nickel permease